MFAVGDTLTEAVLPPVPAIQLKLLPPEAVSVVLCPEQTVLLPLMEAVGVAVTFNVNVAVVLHPELVPVTVYTVVEEGVTVIADVVWPPGCHA